MPRVARCIRGLIRAFATPNALIPLVPLCVIACLKGPYSSTLIRRRHILQRRDLLKPADDMLEVTSKKFHRSLWPSPQAALLSGRERSH